MREALALSHDFIFPSSLLLSRSLFWLTCACFNKLSDLNTDLKVPLAGYDIPYAVTDYDHLFPITYRCCHVTIIGVCQMFRFFYDVIAVIASNSCRAVMAISDNCKIILLRHWPLTRVWHLPFTCLLHCFVSWPRVIGYCHQMNLGLNGQCLLYVVSKAACLLRISSSLCANVPYPTIVLWFGFVSTRCVLEKLLKNVITVQSSFFFYINLYSPLIRYSIDKNHLMPVSFCGFDFYCYFIIFFLCNVPKNNELTLNLNLYGVHLQWEFLFCYNYHCYSHIFVKTTWY